MDGQPVRACTHPVEISVTSPRAVLVRLTVDCAFFPRSCLRCTAPARATTFQAGLDECRGTGQSRATGVSAPDDTHRTPRELRIVLPVRFRHDEAHIGHPAHAATVWE